MTDCMRYGLSHTTINSIRTVFAQFPEIKQAVLYGSRAMGNYKRGSDIDLTLHGEALTHDLRASIALALDELPLPYTMDLSLYDAIWVPAICLSFTKARTTNTLTSTARGELRMVATMIAPCSVKA